MKENRTSQAVERLATTVERMSTIDLTASTMKDTIPAIAAYLRLRGAKLQGVDKVGERRLQFTLTHPRMMNLVNEFNAHKPIRFSPRAFLEKLRYLKVTHWHDREQAQHFTQVKA